MRLIIFLKMWILARILKQLTPGELPTPRRTSSLAHLAATTHQTHAANRWAKHAGEFGTEHTTGVAQAFVVARMVDFGMTVEAACELLNDRVAARARKAA